VRNLHPFANCVTRKLDDQHRARSDIGSLLTLHCESDEELIKYGWEEDVWFHVDNLSSAHIYVRLPEGENWENISEDLLTDCAQLTKANSIEGMTLVL
jgi:hypothetical protein